LVWWIWFGGGVLVLGAVVTLWPGARVPNRAAARRPIEGYAATLAGKES
jgi:hypothetical protein